MTVKKSKQKKHLHSLICPLQYVKSTNCHREFRFAKFSVDVPIVVVVVGTGYKWAATDVSENLCI